jgi:hypothetical protein
LHPFHVGSEKPVHLANSFRPDTVSFPQGKP